MTEPSRLPTARHAVVAAGDWIREGRRVVLALLVDIEGSAPLAPGAAMLIAEDGAIEGSITGGCVEAAVVGEAREVFAGGLPRTVTYGLSDELAGTVGLTCGGTVHVFVQELAGEAAEIVLRAQAAIAADRPVAIATLLEGPRAGAKLAIVDGEVAGGLGSTALLDRSVARDAEGLLAQGRTAVRRYGADGATLGDAVPVHITSFATAPTMVIFGAIDFSAALAGIAGAVGYRVTISDPRAPFLRAPRFESVARVEVGWPEAIYESLTFGPRDAILVFSHDPKLDVPAVRGALATEAGYIGALGSRKTTEDRRRRLLEDGVPDHELDRVHAPCGLDIGSTTPEEVAISVLGEVIAVRAGRGGEPLREGSKAIHPRQRQDEPDLPLRSSN
ncbi:MAG TPA: XdhC/CoxI family protein [Solirubrobacterales bacterium]